MAQSIREIIKEKSDELRNVSSLGPTKASEELVVLTSLLSTLNEYISEKRFWLNTLRMQKLEELKVAVKAKMAAEASQEWRDFYEADMQKEALTELIRSLKVYIKNAGEELRFTK